MELIGNLRHTLAGSKKTDLEKCFRDLGTTLKLHRRDRKNLPWYLLLGTAHSDKKSLLRSAIDIDGRAIGSYRDADGELDCEWWLAGQAVLADMGGRFLLNDESHNHCWSNFTALLRKRRQPQAVNAVILAISAGEALNGDMDHLQACARTLRRRLQDLQGVSSHRIPCYVVFNKCDTLPGFSDYFASLTDDDRKQILGTTLPPDAGIESLAQEISALEHTLHALLPLQLQAERQASCRRSQIALPIAFSALSMRCLDFCKLLFPTAYNNDTAILRGIYFTAAGNGSNGYFSERLFDSVLVADSLSISKTRDDHPRAISNHRLAATALVATAMLLLTLWSAAFIKQMRNLDDVRALLQHYASTQESADTPRLTLNAADRALAALDQIKTADSTGIRWSASIGMHDSSLTEAINSHANGILQQQWLPKLAADIFSSLTAMNDKPGEQFNALKAWLMLVDPTHRDMKYLMRWLDQFKGFDTRQKIGIQSRLQQLYLHSPQFSIPFSRSALQSVQQELASIAPQDRIYGRWQSRHAGKSLALKPLLGSNAEAVFSAPDQVTWAVPALYTADVYRTLRFDADMPELLQFEQDQWVFGTAATPLTKTQRAHIAQSLRQRYSKDYADAWSKLFNALSLRHTTDTADLLQQLQMLSDSGTSPLARLLRIATQNTQVIEESDTVIRMTTEQSATLAATLGELRNWLDNANRSASANEALSSDGAGAENPPRKTMQLAQQLPQPVSQWIATLARNASNSASNTVSQSIDAAWKQQVADFCRANIEDRYPFNPRAVADANFGSFVEYFKPGGIEDSFVQQRLGDVVERNSWTLKPGAGVRLSIRTLQMMRQAQRIRAAFFHDGQIGFSYRLAPVRMSANLQRFTLNAGATHFEYSHGPRQATQLMWPQQPASLNIQFTSLQDSEVTRNHDGIWGLYRLIDTSGKIQRSDIGSTLILRDNDYSIELSLAATTVSLQPGSQSLAVPNMAASDNPLQRELLSGYKCIAHLR